MDFAEFHFCRKEQRSTEIAKIEGMDSLDQPTRCTFILRNAKDANVILAAIKEFRTFLNESEIIKLFSGSMPDYSKPRSSTKHAPERSCLDNSFLVSLKVVFESYLAVIESVGAEGMEQLILEEILRLLIELMHCKTDNSERLIFVGFDKCALEIIAQDISKTLYALSTTFLKHALDKHGSLVAVNDTMIHKIIEVIQIKPLHKCLRLESCDETCKTRMYSIHMGLCNNILSFKPQSVSYIHIKKLVIALCVCLNSASNVEPMVIDLLVQVCRARDSVFVATVIKRSFVPTIVSLLFHANTTSLPGVVKLIISLFADGKHAWQMAQSSLLTYLPMILYKFDDEQSTLCALRLLCLIATEKDSADFFFEFGIATYMEFWLKSNRHAVVKGALTILYHILATDGNDLIIHELLMFDRYHIVSCLVDIVEDHRRYRPAPMRTTSKIAADCLVEVIALIIETEYRELEKDNIWFAAAERLLENELRQSVESNLALFSGYNALLDELNDGITRLQETITLVF